MIPVRGVLQEARVPQELGTPIYIDSSSTTFVATNRAAPKKSTWVRRKSEELNECHELGESVPIKAGDLVEFPAGLRCTWTVHQPVRKHYQFG